MLDSGELSDLGLKWIGQSFLNDLSRCAGIGHDHIGGRHNDLRIFFFGGEKGGSQTKDRQGCNQKDRDLGVNEVSGDLTNPATATGFWSRNG